MERVEAYRHHQRQHRGVQHVRRAAVRDLAADVDEVQRACADGREMRRRALADVDGQHVGAEDEHDVVVELGNGREQRGGRREAEPAADAVAAFGGGVHDEVGVDGARDQHSVFRLRSGRSTAGHCATVTQEMSRRCTSHTQASTSRTCLKLARPAALALLEKRSTALVSRTRPTQMGAEPLPRYSTFMYVLAGAARRAGGVRFLGGVRFGAPWRRF